MSDMREPSASDLADVGEFLNSLDHTQVEGVTVPEAPETPSEPSGDAEDLEEGDTTDEPSQDAEEASEAHENVDEEADDSEDEDSGDEEPEDEEELDSVEKRIRHLQSLHDRQMAEVQQQLENMQQWAQQVYQAQLAQQQAALQAQQQAQPQQVHVTSEQIEQGVETNLVGTFQWVVQNRPDLVATTISKAREKHGNEIGDQMQLEYAQYREQQLREEYQAQFEAQRQAEAQAQLPQQVEQTMTQLVDGIAQQYGDAFNEVKDEFVQRAQETAGDFREYMNSQGLEMTPDALHYFLTKTFNDVREERLNAQAAKPRKPKRLPKEAHVETSTSGERPEDATAEQRAINEILMGARALDIDVSVPTR